jgi:hypothetical protein
MFKILLLSIALIAIVFILFSVKILIDKNAKFPSGKIGGNRELNKRGIHCPQTQDKVERKKNKVHHVHY